MGVKLRDPGRRSEGLVRGDAIGGYAPPPSKGDRLDARGADAASPPLNRSPSGGLLGDADGDDDAA